MGNTSSEGSSFTTDDSASESAASSMLHHARTPSSQTSRGSFGGGSGVGLPTTPVGSHPNVPQEPPDADLSHLTDEERAHIMSVLNRARGIQEREESRVSELEADFSDYSRDVQRRSSDAEAAGITTYERCPICHTTELVPDPQPGSAQEGLACSDCDRLVCLQCGFYTPAIATEKETWLCTLCQRRRRFIALSGLWHEGRRRRRNNRTNNRNGQRRSSLDEAALVLEAKETWLCTLCQRRRRFIALSGLWHEGRRRRRNNRTNNRNGQRRSSLDEAALVLEASSPKTSKPPLERTQSFSQYEEMRATPDGASNPITPPRSSREDMTLPERFGAAVDQPQKPEDLKPPAKSIAPIEVHPVSPHPKPSEPEAKIDSRGKAAHSPQTPPFSSKSATTPPGSLKALETLLKEAETTRKDKKAEEERVRKEEADRKEPGRKQSDIKREEYEAEEADDSDVEIQMDEFPFDLNDEEMMRQLLEMSQTADHECSTTTSMSSMSEDDDREQYLAELNERNQRDTDFHDYTSRETDEEYLDASSPEPELTEILEEEEEYEEEVEMEDVSDSRSKPIIAAPAEPRKPRRGQRYEHTGPMETLHETAAEHEPPSPSPVVKAEQPPVYSQPPPSAAPMYTRPAAVQRAFERQQQLEKEKQQQQQQHQQPQQQGDQFARPIDKNKETDRYGRPIDKERESDKFNQPSAKEKESDKYGRSIDKKDTDRYGRPIEKEKETDSFGRPVDKRKETDMHGKPIEKEKELDKFGRPIEQERETDRFGKPIEKQKETDRFGRPIEKEKEPTDLGDLSTSERDRQIGTKETDRFGRPIEKEKETDRFGRPVDKRKETDRHGKPIEKEKELDKFGRPIEQERETDRFGKPIEKQKETDRFGRPIEKEKEPDRFGRPVDKRKETDKYGRPIEKEKELDKFGKPVDKRKETDKNGKPIEKEKELDKFGRPIKQERETDRFSKPIEKQTETDRFGRPIEKEKQAEKGKETDQFGRPIEKQREVDKYGRPVGKDTDNVSKTIQPVKPETDKYGRPVEKDRDIGKYMPEKREPDRFSRVGGSKDKDLSAQWDRKNLDRFGRPIKDKSSDLDQEEHRTDETDFDKFGRPVEKKKDPERFKPHGQRVDRPETDRFGRPIEKDKELDRFGRPIDRVKEQAQVAQSTTRPDKPEIDKYGRPIVKEKELDKFGRPIDKEKELDKPKTRPDKVEYDRFGRPIVKELDKFGQPTTHPTETDQFGKPVERTKDKTGDRVVDKPSEMDKTKDKPGRGATVPEKTDSDRYAKVADIKPPVLDRSGRPSRTQIIEADKSIIPPIVMGAPKVETTRARSPSDWKITLDDEEEKPAKLSRSFDIMTVYSAPKRGKSLDIEGEDAKQPSEVKQTAEVVNTVQPGVPKKEDKPEVRPSDTERTIDKQKTPERTIDKQKTPEQQPRKPDTTGYVRPGVVEQALSRQTQNVPPPAKSEDSNPRKGKDSAKEQKTVSDAPAAIPYTRPSAVQKAMERNNTKDKKDEENKKPHSSPSPSPKPIPKPRTSEPEPAKGTPVKDTKKEEPAYVRSDAVQRAIERQKKEEEKQNQRMPQERKDQKPHSEASKPSLTPERTVAGKDERRQRSDSSRKPHVDDKRKDAENLPQNPKKEDVVEKNPKHNPDQRGAEAEKPEGGEGAAAPRRSVASKIQQFELEARKQEPITLTESEKGLISSKLSRTSKGFVKRAASVEDDQLGRTHRTDPIRAPKPKRKSFSVDAYESLSDSEIKPRKPKRDNSFPPVPMIKPSGSDPKLGKGKGSPTKNGQSVVQAAMQRLLQPPDNDEDVEDKYRSVEDLTKLGNDDDDDDDDDIDIPQSTHLRMPTPPVQQMQLPPSFSNNHRKPPSLMKRRGRNRAPVMDIPLSPIWDVEVTSPDEADHPAGDFSSPEYADPSLAEESPLEYDEDEEPPEPSIRKEIHVIEATDIPESVIDDDDEDDMLDDDTDISMPDENANLDSLSGYSSRSEERLETLIEEQEEETFESGGGKSPVEDIIVQEITKSTESFTRHVASIDINLNRPGYAIKPDIKDNPPKPQPAPPKPLPKPVVQPPKPAPKPVVQPPKPLPKPVVAPPKPQPAVIPPPKPPQTVIQQPTVLQIPKTTQKTTPKPVTQQIKPATQPVKPATQPIKQATQPIKPVTQPIKPVTQPIKPVTQPIKPVTQPIKPVTQPSKPATQPKPVTQPIKPVTQPIKPVTQPAVHKPYHFPERSARLTGDGQEDKNQHQSKNQIKEPKVIIITKQVKEEPVVKKNTEQTVKSKPPPLALTGSDVQSHSASIDSDGDSVLDSPRSPDHDLLAFEKPRVASPIRRLGEFSPPTGSPITLRHHKCSPPITPKHFGSHKHFREETFPREISDYTVSESTSSTGVSPTNKDYKHVLTQMGSSFDEFAHRKDIASRMSPKSRGGHSAFEFPPRHHHDIHHITTKVASTDAGTSTDSPVEHRSFRYDHAHTHGHALAHPVRTQHVASTQFGSTTSAASQTSISDDEREHHQQRTTSTTRTKILIDAAVDTTFESPSMSPVSPTHALHAPRTSSIAVGTSPEYSPASSVASTDTESARIRSHSLLSEGDTSEWGTTMPLSSRASSSGASTPERSSSLTSTPLRHQHRYREHSSSSVTSSPASRGTTTTSEADSLHYRIPSAMLTKAQRDSSLTRASSSDVDSADSDGGTPSSSSSRKVKRRLPSVPAGVLPVTATRGTYDERDLEAIDPAKKLEMQKVRELLTKKAAELQLLRYEEELRKLQDESDRLRSERASARIRGRHDHRYTMMGGRGRFFNEGSLSDSDLSQTGLDYDTHEFSRLGYGLGLGATSLSMHSLPTESSSYGTDDPFRSTTSKYGLDSHSPPRKVYLSKSEEDIIREIEKQISETTGKDYRAYDRNEIERQVRARYGDYDSDGSTASSHSRTSENQFSRTPLELPDYRLRSVRQKLKEELRQVTADKKAELDSSALTSLGGDVVHRSRRGAGDGGPSTTATTSTSSSSRAQTVPIKVQSKEPQSASIIQAVSPSTPRLQSLQITHTAQASTSPQKRKSNRPKSATDSQPPMFSPIKEDVDIEAEVAQRLRLEMNGQRVLLDAAGLRGQRSDIIQISGNGRRRRKDNGNGAHAADVERLGKEGELIEKRIREQQEKQFRREIERRKRQMEESARKLEELKAKRKMDTAGGQMSKASTSMDTLDGGADQTPLGDRNSVQYRSLDIDSGGRERQRTAPTRDSSMSMSTGHLVERERRIRMDEQGLILPLEDGSTEDVKPKQERRSRRDMMSDERNIRRTIRSDEYGGRELSPTSYSEFQQREVGTAALKGRRHFRPEQSAIGLSIDETYGRIPNFRTEKFIIR
ncbi:LOW QUALITY PROTEIN: uncharacterized protein [Amphiura filiformis]|uniref:LOW QUALITY PROTEIN: uncharacterized protein n=1 Tax=Amphiura filiformis TaxID=82378 RepID=UPI003B210060